MMVKSYPIQTRQGDTTKLTVLYQDVQDDPIDLTGYTYEWFVTSNNVAHTYTTTPEVVVSAPLTGVIVLTLSAAETAALFNNLAFYWLRITSPSGVKTTLLEGNVDFN